MGVTNTQLTYSRMCVLLTPWTTAGVCCCSDEIPSVSYVGNFPQGEFLRSKSTGISPSYHHLCAGKLWLQNFTRHQKIQLAMITAGGAKLELTLVVELLFDAMRWTVLAKPYPSLKPFNSASFINKHCKVRLKHGFEWKGNLVTVGEFRYIS